MSPKVKKYHFQNEWLANEDYSNWVQAFRTIDQELNAHFVKQRLTFQIWVFLLLTPMLLGKNISRLQVQLFLLQYFSKVS